MLRQLKNSAWTQRQMGIWRAAGERKLEPARATASSAGWSDVVAEPRVSSKIYLSPERSEWAAASHGVGRKPGDGKSLLHNKLRPPCHPLTSLGVPGIINTKPSVPPHGGSTLGYYYAALTGSKFRYADAPQTTLQITICPSPPIRITHQFLIASSIK